MPDTKLVIIGGFLGAGKTTCILRIAKKLVSLGKKVGIVTNDQGDQLVDTAFLQSERLPVLEVTGGCFCCNFDDFAGKVKNMTAEEKPDVILAEPVGSCTDLVATIFKPLRKDGALQFKLSPLCIVVDPVRLKKLMLETEKSLFPNEINYLFEKQLEEADVLLLNKTDLLTEQEVERALVFLKGKFMGAAAIAISAKNDLALDGLLPVILGAQAPRKSSLDIDYGTYGRAEERLGWFNSRVMLKSKVPVDFNAWISMLMDRVKKAAADEKCEIAHLKAYLVADDDFAKASVTGIDEEVDFGRKMRKKAGEVTLIINARIGMEPARLSHIMEQALLSSCGDWGIEPKNPVTECFSPTKPNPRYRIGGA